MFSASFIIKDVVNRKQNYSKWLEKLLLLLIPPFPQVFPYLFPFSLTLFCYVMIWQISPRYIKYWVFYIKLRPSLNVSIWLYICINYGSCINRSHKVIMIWLIWGQFSFLKRDVQKYLQVWNYYLKECLFTARD